jgi:hypothetical protein
MLTPPTFLGPITICNPDDPAIDREAWGDAGNGYLHDHTVQYPLPPVKAGEELTTVTLSPMAYGAMLKTREYIVQHAGGEDGYYRMITDPEVMRHVLIHSVTDVSGMYYPTSDGGRRQVILRHEDGPYGRRLTAEVWESIAPFVGSPVWALATGLLALRALDRLSAVAK